MSTEEPESGNQFEIGEWQFTEELNPTGLGDSIVLRIARRPLHDQAREKLLELCGNSARIFTCTNLLFGNDPTHALQSVIDALEEEGYDVMAVDLAASWEIKQTIVTSKKIAAPILVQQLERDWDNEVITIGRDESNRDILKVLAYCELQSGSSE